MTEKKHSGNAPSFPTNELPETFDYDWDLNGYCVVKNALNVAEISELLMFWEQRLSGKEYHTLSFDWGPVWQSLIDLKTVLPIVEHLVGRSARLDHAFCVDHRFGNPDELLHHQSGGFDQGCYYIVDKGRMYNGLIGVIFSLFDPAPKSPTFACIPGSHKSGFATPEHYYDLLTSDWKRIVHVDPGDAIIFSEALTHGTFLGAAKQEDRKLRRAVMMKYTPGHIAFRRPVDSPLQEELPRMPDFPHYCFEGRLNLGNLTPRQRAIVGQPAFFRKRPREI